MRALTTDELEYVNGGYGMPQADGGGNFDDLLDSRSMFKTRVPYSIPSDIDLTKLKHGDVYKLNGQIYVHWTKAGALEEIETAQQVLAAGGALLR